ncbi:type 1 glutamine amidotransferase domain-containing protein [Corynebacterium lubricantis]|uniref:type 1 glutamine amidotransferase domain-containing protein n=1 Tax=Corynebacterium lubricantis TaxID=541095 RepID=UPI0003717670|nr:type 1 glutamine amidotransferase domain-containing protein [Corynebacterium lubricantis]
MAHLIGKTIAVIATNGFEDSELASPVEAAKEVGAEVKIISTETGTIRGKNDTEESVDLTTAEANPADFDALLLPGGTANADRIRMDDAAVDFVRGIFAAGKPTAVICHGGWILTDADVLQGRTLTSYRSLKTDLTNAGATWVDEEVHVDNGLVSSRTPADLEAFNAALIEEFAK